MREKIEKILTKLEESRESEMTVKKEKKLVAEAKHSIIRELVLTKDKKLVSNEEFRSRIEDNGFEIAEVSGRVDVYSTGDSAFAFHIARRAFSLVKNNNHPDEALPSVEEEMDRVIISLNG